MQRRIEEWGCRTLEIWDLADPGEKPEKMIMVVDQNISVKNLIEEVASSCDRTVGSFGLILQLGRHKTNVMDYRRDVTLSDIGVKFEFGNTYTLYVIDSPSSPSETNELTEFEDKNTRKLNQISGDLSSPDKAMLLVEGTAESPINDTETKASTPTDDDTPGVTIYTPTGFHFRDRAKYGTGEDASTTDDDTTGATIVQPEQFDSEGFGKNGKKRPIFWKLSRSERDRERIDMQGQEDSETNRRSENAYVGLVNQAMTCYLNSLIQALYMTPEFRNALYNWEYVHSSEKDEANSIPYQLQKLFLNLQTSSKNAIETTSLTKSFGWDSTEAWQQHDIQELCRVMFDALEQKFKNTAQADLINRLYEGKMMDYVKCLECGTEKLREDTFLDIPLPVRPFGSNVAYNSVEDALGAFVQPETLDGTNQYHCDTCNKKCDAHKGLKFTKFPYFLTLHLKRFDFDYNTFHRIKLNDEVTFPDLLNLNSFIPSTSAQDSPFNEEGAKCDDSSTTDSGNLEDECAPCENGMLVSDNSTNENHDDDEEEDEGIERSNGPSTSACNSHNHDSEKNRENQAGPRGPYEYELFSIMIHSGSASGGHYYAYIKDFRTGEWLCFNDQNVSTITYDDIQRTYGGGPARAYYSGVYSSSTNAYMLMYRQIDPERNALPMQVVDFPKHLQELLIKMQETEYNDMKNREMQMQMYRLKVYCNHPIKKTMIDQKMFCLHDETWGELTERAYKNLFLENTIERDCVRLVTYQPSNGLIDCSFDGYEHEPLSSLLDDQTDLLLEIRKKNETFQTYLPGGVATRVYVMDIAIKEVTKVINLRGILKQTIQEYKEQLSREIGLEVKLINLIIQHPNDTPRLIRNNENSLQQEGFSSANKIFVPTSFADDTKKSIEESMSRITNIILSLISLNIELPDLSEEALRDQNIPTLEEKKKEKTNETPVSNGPTKLSSSIEITRDTEKTEVNEVTTKSNVGDELSTVLNKTTSPSTIQTDVEDWNTPEQSNSEDSSLSYSDRTLVGEGDASEDDDFPLANADSELSNQTNQENNQTKDPTEHFFTATRDDHGPDKLLRILVNKRMNLGTLKKLLEPYIGVPAEYFRVFYQPAREMECTRLSMEMTLHDDGAMLRIKLGLALRSDEYKVRLYQLVLDSETEPFRFLCEWVISKEAGVGQTKKEILAELKRKFSIDIPYDRCRLRRMNQKTAANAFLDDKKFEDMRFGWARDMLIQELPDKETIKDPNDVLLFTRRMPLSDNEPGPIQEITVSGKSVIEIREKLSQLSGIPEEHLEMVKGSHSLPDDLVVFLVQKENYWIDSLMTPENSLSFSIEDGTFIYYRDSRQKPRELSAEELQDITARRKSRMYALASSTSRYSPRRERALKIYVDDK